MFSRYLLKSQRNWLIGGGGEGLRGGEEGRDHAKNLAVGLEGVVEPGGVNEGDGASAEGEWVRGLDRLGDGAQAVASREGGPADEVDELQQFKVTVDSDEILGERTVDFPVPVAPITLRRKVSSSGKMQ